MTKLMNITKKAQAELLTARKLLTVFYSSDFTKLSHSERNEIFTSYHEAWDILEKYLTEDEQEQFAQILQRECDFTKFDPIW